MPSILLKAPPIKTPQAAEYDDSFYEDAIRIILELLLLFDYPCYEKPCHHLNKRAIIRTFTENSIKTSSEKTTVKSDRQYRVQWCDDPEA